MSYQKLTPIVATGTTTPRYFGDRFADVVNVKDFGAKGDGVTDDTLSVHQADLYARSVDKTVYFPDGEYVVLDITAKASWHMSPQAKLLKVLSSSDRPVVTFDADNKHHGRIVVDAQNTQSMAVVRVYGNDCVFDSIHIMNLTGDEVLSRGLYVTCSRSVFNDIRLDNFVNTGYDNDSVPQGVCLSGEATGNNFDLVVSNGCRATVLINTVGKNHFGNIFCYGSTDNGVYAFREGSVTLVDSLYYDGYDSALGVRHQASVYIDTVKIASPTINALFFGNINTVYIDTIYANIDDEQKALFAIDDTTQGETLTSNGDITINNIFGKIGTLVYFPNPKDNLQQKIGSLTINNVDVDTIFDLSNETGAVTRYNFIDVSACDKINFGNFNIRVFIKGSVSLNITCSIPNPITKESSVGKMNVRFYDYSTKALRSTTVGDAFFVRAVAQEKMSASSGFLRFNGNQMMINNSMDLYTDLRVGSAPTSGTYRTGQILWRQTPSNGIAGYICLAGGSPGTWGTIPYNS